MLICTVKSTRNAAKSKFIYNGGEQNLMENVTDNDTALIMSKF